MLVESASLTSLVDPARAVNDFLSHSLVGADPFSAGNANPHFRTDAGALLSGAAVAVLSWPVMLSLVQDPACG